MNNMKKMAMLLLLAAAGNSATAQYKVVLEAGTPYTINSTAEVASIGGTVLYHWYRNGSKIEGATGLSYTVPTEEAVGSNVQFKRAAYLEGCEERKFSNSFTITWCNLVIDGVCWADANVTQPGAFAPKPDMYTEFYQWGQPYKAWPATGYATGWINNVIIATSAWPATPCPEGWRLPTRTEFQALHNAGSTWVESGTRGATVAGRFYGPNHDTPASCTLPSAMTSCIFLPAAGYRPYNENLVYSQDARGIYWHGASNFATLDFTITSSNPLRGHDSKAYGFSLRCVQ